MSLVFPTVLYLLYTTIGTDFGTEALSILNAAYTTVQQGCFRTKSYTDSSVQRQIEENLQHLISKQVAIQ